MNLKALTSDRLETLYSLRKEALRRASGRTERRTILELMRSYRAELSRR